MALKVTLLVTLFPVVVTEKVDENEFRVAHMLLFLDQGANA